MKAHAANLSDLDIDKIADYFSSFKAKITTPEDVKIIDEANSCVGCHGVDGNSEVPTFPRIAGQYEDYLYQSLKSYKNGKRNNAIMNGVASTLNDDQMINFFQYYNDSNMYNFVQPVKDMILFFPSWFEHDVEENKSNEERISIGFNIFPEVDDIKMGNAYYAE